MSWSDIIAACGVCLAVACVSLAAALREHVLPLFIDSNCAPDTDSSSTDGDEHDSTLEDADAARDPYTERPPHTIVSRRLHKQKSKAIPDVSDHS